MGNDLILFNGNIHTMDQRAPMVSAVAVRDGRIAFAGSEEGARAALAERRGAPALDLGGRCVVPGLTDAHLHFRWYAESLRAVDVETPSLAESLVRVGERAGRGEPGEWITGTGWNHNVWEGGAFPTRAHLDRISPRNPVALKAKSGHAMWVNSLALAQAGITGTVPDPDGGRIVRGGDGDPTGILLENAMDLVQAVIPKPAPHELAGMMRDAQEAAHRAGLTGIHDFDGALAFQAFRLLEERGELSLRVEKGIPHELLSEAIRLGLRTGFGGELLRLGAVKMFADGALGSLTAWMLSPYEGTRNTGIATLAEETLRDDVYRANAAGLACAIHAIGDAACRAVLDAFARAGAETLETAGTVGTGGTAGPRPRNRIEHAQLLHPDDLARLARLGVVASMQPIHATSDMHIAERHWGPRCAGAYAWNSLLAAGTTLAFGSDCPVETLDPLAGIHAASTRRRADGSPGPKGWRPAQRIGVEQAVAAYTLGAAFAAGREGDLGALAPGKLADLTVLGSDIFSIDPHAIRETKAEATIVGGRIVYRAF